MIRHRTGASGTTTVEQQSEHTNEQRYFLARLAHLTRRAALLERYLVPTDRRMRLLSHAIFATYEDCAALGLRDSARAILADAGRGAPSARR